MALHLMETGGTTDLKPRITVFGVGGAGGNAVNNMIEKKLDGVEFVVANTDAQALQQCLAPSKIQMGVKVTEGLGAGARPSVGSAAAEESLEQIIDHLAGAHMCFITAGMGGGTGTGAAPIIAHAARELGVLTVGVVTKPFQFEGAKRMRQAEEGVDALQKVVDTLIIIPNQNLFRLANEKTTFTEAFSMADDVLYQGVKGVTDLMVRPGLINLDFADVRSVMDEMGKAMMGTGEADGEDRAVQAAEKAIANPLLDEISLKGAKGVLINITGGYDLTLFELDEAANRIREEVDPDANIIVGSTLDAEMEGVMRVSVVATGIDALESSDTPQPRRSMAEPLVSATRQMAEVAAAEEAEETPAVAAAAETTETGKAAELRTEAAPAASAGLFDDMPPAAAEPGGFDPQAAGQDDLPPPAYRPDAAAEEAAQYVAPKADAAPPPPGTPTPEAIARLRAAVGKASAAAPAEQAPAQEPVTERTRFGIKPLLNRMTGHGGETAERPRREQPPLGNPAASRPVPETPRSPEAAPDPEEERIEIPAFLRRQAN